MRCIKEVEVIGKSDIFITSYRESALDGVGFDYETLHNEFPGPVWAGISGYSEEGPMTDAPGYDSLCYFGRTGIVADLLEAILPLSLRHFPWVM